MESTGESKLTRLADGLYVHHGSVNVGILVDGDRAVLIDYGEGEVSAVLPDLGIRQVEAVYLTHYHRDQLSGLSRGSETFPTGARIVVPIGEREWIESPQVFWNDPTRRWHLYEFHPYQLVPAAPVAVDAVCREADTFDFGPWSIRVVGTPGHTDDGVSYLVEGADQKVIFLGDLIAGPGQIWDIYSLQRGGRFGDLQIRDYHGFLGARPLLLASLEQLVAAGPDLLVPSHGVLMTNPSEAIYALRANLNSAYADYQAISAGRYYFPSYFSTPVDDREVLPIRDGSPIPPFLRHVGTTWIVVSEDGAALVMDCGTRKVIEEVTRMQASGEITTVEALWISHYHDDHVDCLPEFQERFPCPTYADATVADVVTNPAAYNLPCLSPAVARIDRALAHGERWRWREFELTNYRYPSQTYYHGALLVEGRGRRLFFIGDSFTPSGIDDYCAGNRNLLGSTRGYAFCLRLIEELRPDALFNCHVQPAFIFGSDDLALMQRNLTRRLESFGRLVPWDHPNYGLDEHWARAYPYEQSVGPGNAVTINLQVTNHSSSAHEASAIPVVPAGWHAGGAAMTIPPESDLALPLQVEIPSYAPAGRYAIPIRLRYAGRALGQFREAILNVREE